MKTNLTLLISTLILFVFIFYPVSFLMAQNVTAKMTVVSFTKDETDMSARVISPRKDKNGKVCSIIKLETTLSLGEFKFDGGMIGIEHTEQKKGEIWIYQSPGARYLTITHQYHEPVRRYEYFEPLQEATVYIMKITASNVQITLTDNTNLQYVVMNCPMEGATVSFDEMAPEPFIDGVFSNALLFGKHKYIVEAPLYAPIAGTITIGREKPDPININLKPQFGQITVHSTPEQLADVYIDGKKIGNTPLVIDRLASGEHKIKIIKKLFFPVDDTLVITDNSQRIKAFELKPNYAKISLKSKIGAAIYINEEFAGTGEWNDRLSPGTYKVVARKDAHRESITMLDITSNEEKIIELEDPVPITGSIDINSNVSTKITIDGKDYGTTPQIITGVLIGVRNLQLDAEGYMPYNKNITITEGKILPVRSMLVRDPLSKNKIKKEAIYSKPKESKPKPPYAYFINFKMSMTSKYGGMVGFVKRVGLYVGYMGGTSPNSGKPATDLNISELSKAGYFRSAISFGPILRLTKNIHIYAGGGYGTYGPAYQSNNSEDVKYYITLDKGPEVEGGLLLKFKYISLFGGYNTMISPIKFGEIHFGIGASF